MVLMQTVVETPSYLADAERLFSSEERRAIVDRLAADPRCGVVRAAVASVRCGSASERAARAAARELLSFQRREPARICSGGFRQKREVRPFARRAQCASQSGCRYDRKLPETKMTKAAFDKIKTGLEETRAYLDGSGNKRGYGILVPARVNVKKIRTRLGLSQESFAQTYGFALSAVRDWEQGRRQPERSARILLRVVEREPEAVTRALAKTA
jgi:putative transcriptional regulator